MMKNMKQRGVGVHVKTAGTTWLEEVAGLAAAGGEGLEIAKTIYAKALPRFDELIAPYATVIDIQAGRLPCARDVDGWDCEQFVRALRHVPDDSLFNAEFRQFIHVSFKVAAELGDRYREALRAHAPTVSRFVTANIYERHLLPIFGCLGKETDVGNEGSGENEEGES
jgi:tagaturonate epimerase